MSERQRCPEYGCGLALREDELIAHLEWDHNRGALEAEQMVEEVDSDD